MTQQGIDKAVSQLNMSAELALVEPTLSLILTGLEEAVKTRMFRKIASGEITDTQVAVNAWTELYSYQRVRSRLTQAMKMGQSAEVKLNRTWSHQIEENEDGEG